MSHRGGRPNAWMKPYSNKPQRPHGLKGKEIGLYYKDLNKKNVKDPNFVKEIWSDKVTLVVPPAVISRVQNNLAAIRKTAKNEKIKIPVALTANKVVDLTDDYIPLKVDKEYNTDDYIPLNVEKICNIIPVKPEKEVIDLEIDNKVKIETDSEIQVGIGSEKKNETVKPTNIPMEKEAVINNDIEVRPGSSSAPDFIPIPKDEEYHAPSRQCSLRGPGDYKYGYDDIITGSFQEKLEESVSKGITINCSTQEKMDLSVAMHEEYKDMIKKPAYKKYMKFRETLPTYKKAKEILEVVNSSQVVVITGETGCGKSTQVPQLILDEAIVNNRGANVRITVTQPRRIAASSLAMRVSEERGENMGNSVGYAVRLERVEPRPRGSILFCTTGVLLADVEVNQGLVNVSHVILDEVHERDCNIDLTLCVLRQVIEKRKDLKVILMSATIDAARLASFFDNCPILHIEGLAYPVHDVYLEEILEITQYTLPEQPPKNNSNYKGKKKRPFFGQGRDNANKEMEKEIQYNSVVGSWVEAIRKNISGKVYNMLKNYRIEELNIDLIYELLLYLCRGPKGAILVFLPGIGEITKLLRKIENSKLFPSSSYEIYPLHSKLPSLEQHKIFERPPGNIRKIIIATNIAETSITIDDIVYVIDCGKIKMTGRNIEDNVSTLQMEWIAQANLKQRRGRAGRCQPGICYHMLTSHRAGLLPERHLPELQRSNLLEPLLAVKRLRLGKAEDAFKLVPDQPPSATVEWAVKHLQRLGALDEKEILTPLGWHLARLPVHPAAGKLLLLGALFGCLDRAASVAAVWGFKDPFQLVIGKEQQVDKAKKALALGEPSDHVAMSEAIIQWENMPYKQRRDFEYDYFLSHSTLEQLSEMKKQLADGLKQMGFLNTRDIRSSWENRNSSNLSLFKAVVAASLYPNIGRVRWHCLYRPKRPKRITCRTPEDGAISLHPSSVMAKKAIDICNNPGANWLVYWMKQRSSDLFLIDVTLVYTLPILFFGELNSIVNAEDNSNDCFIKISSIKVRCMKETANVLLELRSLLDHVLAHKVMSKEHSVKFSDFEDRILNTVIDIISAEDERSDTLGGDDHSDSELSEYESSNKRSN